MGLVSNGDFSKIIAIKRYDLEYVWMSDDKGISFHLICYNELNFWGNLCASRDLQIMVLTDAKTLNSHVSQDHGVTWSQIFCDEKPNGDFKISVNGSVNACAVSYDGNSMALGFTGGSLYVINNCVLSEDESCEAKWRPQNTTSGEHDTKGVALSKDGKHFYSVDASTMEIASGQLYYYSTPSPTASPTPLIPTIYVPTIWSPSPFPTKSPSKQSK